MNISFRASCSQGGWEQLGIQLLGVVVISSLVVVVIWPVLSLLSSRNSLRVDAITEATGLDILKHTVREYPDFKLEVKTLVHQSTRGVEMVCFSQSLVPPLEEGANMSSRAATESQEFNNSSMSPIQHGAQSLISRQEEETNLSPRTSTESPEFNNSSMFPTQHDAQKVEQHEELHVELELDSDDDFSSGSSASTNGNGSNCRNIVPLV